MISRVDIELNKLYKSVLDSGNYKQPARLGQIPTISKFNHNIELDAGKEALISTIKNVSFRNVLTELLWFLKGDTNIAYLIDNRCHIWNDDAYRYYNTLFPLENITKDEFIINVRQSYTKGYDTPDGFTCYKYGDLGKIYGYQWIKTGAMARVIKDLIINRHSRYLVIDAWDESSFFKDGIRSPEVALPCCHYSMQFYLNNDRTLDIKVIQRSADVFLGVPYNLLSYQILLTIIANITRYKVGKLYWSGGDCHIYDNQVEAVNEYIYTFTEEYYSPTFSQEPKLLVNRSFYDKLENLYNDIRDSEILDGQLSNINKFLSTLEHDDFNLVDYNPIKVIKAPLSTGL